MKKKIYVFAAACALMSNALSAQSVTGKWNGTLDIQGVMKLRIVLNVKEAGGVYTATLLSPDQNAAEIPASKTTFDQGVLTIECASIGMKYSGKLEKDSLKGTFTQGGVNMPLNLGQGEVALVRKQNPVAPYPYNSQDVVFSQKHDGINLAGTFTYPKTGTNFPVVVLLSGSGPQDRDEALMGHRPFLVLADYLTRNGIAVLRFDDRGVGKSQGVYDKAGVNDLANDADAAIQYLKTRKEVNPKKIGIIGHSLGSSIAFIESAGRNKNDVAFVVSMAGMGVKGDAALKKQREVLNKKFGLPDAAAQQNEALITQINELIAKEGVTAVQENPDKYIDQLMPTLLKGNEQVREGFKKALEQCASPEIVSLLAYDPAGDLAKLSCPLFAINGTSDLQVDADQNLTGIATATGNRATTKKYPELNHMFQPSKSGLPTEYGEIETTISPQVLQDIATWIQSVIK
ncbi:MAG: alpha/beta hydrolase family protein [Tannerellaceae bacterium]